MIINSLDALLSTTPFRSDRGKNLREKSALQDNLLGAHLYLSELVLLRASSDYSSDSDQH